MSFLRNSIKHNIQFSYKYVVPNGTFNQNFSYVNRTWIYFLCGKNIFIQSRFLLRPKARREVCANLNWRI